ncbi:MAG TPA: superoxide dismutase [Woeseiaceae bacterium]|nr:superoxide dismutase [Woeseiaceae bacterium]
MSISLPALPYEPNALEPHISARTMQYHYGKHHKGYVAKLNKLIEGTKLEKLDLPDIIRSARDSANTAVLNNAAQAWNHEFLWNSMSPDGGKQPEGKLMDLIATEFGDIGGFKDEFKKAALGQFGSGWTWLVMDGKKLRITSTSNADSPVATDMQPLLTLDVWEHAYYLDYQNERPGYVTAFLENLVNWKFAAANLD